MNEWIESEPLSLEMTRTIRCITIALFPQDPHATQSQSKIRKLLEQDFRATPRARDEADLNFIDIFMKVYVPICASNFKNLRKIFVRRILAKKCRESVVQCLLSCVFMCSMCTIHTTVLEHGTHTHKTDKTQIHFIPFHTFSSHHPFRYTNRILTVNCSIIQYHRYTSHHITTLNYEYYWLVDWLIGSLPSVTSSSIKVLFWSVLFRNKRLKYAVHK